MIRAISSGKVDEDLEHILDAVRRRDRYVTDRAALDLLRKIKPGDKVRIVRNIKPKYLGGLHGTVQSVENDRHRRGFPMVSVDLGGPVRRYGSKILVPIACLEMVQPVEEEEGVRVLDGNEEA